MNAGNYRPGDRIRLVCMDDEHSGHHEGHVGTVLSTCPPPVNVLNVEWDDGFGLNPCLDVDVVEVIGDVRGEREFYTVEEDGDEKFVHYQGFTWYRPLGGEEGEPPCAVTTVAGCRVSLSELGDGWDMSELLAMEAEGCQQYQEDVSEVEMLEANLRFYDGKTCGEHLHVDDVDEETPCGSYYYEIGEKPHGKVRA